MTTAGAAGVGSATPVDSPVASAPGPGNSDDSHVFGQQLQDAHDSLSSQNDDTAPASAAGPKRAAARGPEKKSKGDGEAKSSVPVRSAAPAAAPLPFSLDFGILTGTDQTRGDRDPAGNDVAGRTGRDEQAQPEPAPEVTKKGAPPSGGDLAFALKLDPPAAATVGAANPAAGAAVNSDTTNSQATKSEEANIPAGQNRAAAGIEPRGSATATPPVKDTHHTDQQQEDTPQPAPRNESIARVVTVPAPEKSAPAEAEPAAAQPRIDTAKALEQSSAVQTPGVDAAAKPATPLRELSIQMGQASQDRVEVRVVDRSGELQVAVRSANPDLTQGLRQGLPELVNRLEQNGFHAEAWRPGTTASAIPSAGDTRQRPMQSQQDPSQSQSQSGGQQSRQNNRQNQSNRPQWVQELEGNLSGGTLTGEFHGLTS